jgi:hypothetical protein
MKKAESAQARAYCDAQNMTSKQRIAYMNRLDSALRKQTNQHKKARATAYSEAARRNLWKECGGFVKKGSSLFLRIAARVSKRARAKLEDQTGKLYAYNLKRWTRNIYNCRPGTREYAERLSYERARRKMEKERAKKRLASVSK